MDEAFGTIDLESEEVYLRFRTPDLTLYLTPPYAHKRHA
jgi:hypothetical protein